LTSMTMVAVLALGVPQAVAQPPDLLELGPWAGTIQVESYQAATSVSGQTFEWWFTGTYNNLVRPVPQRTVEPRYQADVSMRWDERVTGDCQGSRQVVTQSRFSYSGPSTATVDTFDSVNIQFSGRDGTAFELWDTAEGTYFYPYFASFNAFKTFECSGITGRQGADALSYQPSWQPTPSTPLVDIDPDPDRLVGTTTYDLLTIPGDFARWDYSAYSYKITYDLRRTELRDSDGDGIPDSDDLCPFTPGSLTLRGCPSFTVQARHAYVGTIAPLSAGGVGGDSVILSGPDLSSISQVCITSVWSVTVRNAKTPRPVLWNGRPGEFLDSQGLPGDPDPNDIVLDVDLTLPSRSVGNTNLVEFPNGRFVETVTIRRCAPPGQRINYSPVQSVTLVPNGGQIMSLSHYQQTTVTTQWGAQVAVLTTETSTADKRVISWGEFTPVVRVG
jgi:hypothetical protein